MKSYRLSELTPGDIEGLCLRNPITDPELMETCREIFDQVSSRGDEAVRSLTERFDGVKLDDIRVGRDGFSQARKSVSQEIRGALEEAAGNIRTFHASQQMAEEAVLVRKGVLCWRETRAIDSVGLYVPGGNAILPSTVLMLGIPAQLAGCRRVQLCVPPSGDGRVAPEVLAAADLAGIRDVFAIGGAQAIAAMALGTESVPAVDKIVGPGNRWVQGGKLLAMLAGTAIDMVAGPTEVLIIADQTASCELICSDLISQAEHGSDSRAILVATSSSVVEEVSRLIWSRIEDLPRRKYAQAALQDSFAVVAESLEKAFDFSNRYAPEHLVLHLEAPGDWVPAVQSAGSVFLGAWSPEVAGDYASGTNHTLPTSGLARAYSGVSLDTFVKKITFQELTEQGLEELAPTLESLASLEGLEGHRRAVRARLEGKN
ncbi:MAG: histidinol dehydrogenase [Acidobacteriota bacterium]